MGKRFLMLVVLIGCMLAPSLAFAVEGRQVAEVEKVISAFKSENVGEIAWLVNFPLDMPYPIPAISGPKDFRARFGLVFDKPFMQRIARSSPLTDWVDMGWRGIMFDNGELWLDDDGNITGVNHSNAAEQKKVENAIRKQKLELNPSLRHFVKPVLDWETKSYRIRIDELANGEFRYAAWKKGESTLEKPSIVLTDGGLSLDGNGGNHFYTFKNGRYRYVCYVTELGSVFSPPGQLEVYKGKRLLMTQNVLKVR